MTKIKFQFQLQVCYSVWYEDYIKYVQIWYQSYTTSDESCPIGNQNRIFLSLLICNNDIFYVCLSFQLTHICLIWRYTFYTSCRYSSWEHLHNALCRASPSRPLYICIYILSKTRRSIKSDHLISHSYVLIMCFLSKV